MHIKITSCQGRRIKLSDKYCSDIPGVAMGEYVVDTVYQGDQVLTIDLILIMGITQHFHYKCHV